VKAYIVTRGSVPEKVHESDAEIVFAFSEGQAKSRSKFYEGKQTYIGLRAKRIPKWDRFAALKYVPDKELLEAGWTLTAVCSVCGRQFDIRRYSRAKVSYDSIGNFKEVICPRCVRKT